MLGRFPIEDVSDFVYHLITWLYIFYSAKNYIKYIIVYKIIESTFFYQLDFKTYSWILVNFEHSLFKWNSILHQQLPFRFRYHCIVGLHMHIEQFFKYRMSDCLSYVLCCSSYSRFVICSYLLQKCPFHIGLLIHIF